MSTETLGLIGRTWQPFFIISMTQLFSVNPLNSRRNLGLFMDICQESMTTLDHSDGITRHRFASYLQKQQKVGKFIGLQRILFYSRQHLGTRFFRDHLRSGSLYTTLLLFHLPHTTCELYEALTVRQSQIRCMKNDDSQFYKRKSRRGGSLVALSNALQQ